MKNLFFLFVLLNLTFAHTQTIPAQRTVNWQVAGIKDTTTQGFTIVDGSTYGFVNDGVTPNDYPLGSLMLAYQGPTIVYFPAGTYLFNASIYLRSNFIIRGAGADQTTFIIEHPNNGHSFYATGYPTNDTTSLTQAVTKGSNQLHVANTSAFAIGDWIQLFQNDMDLTTSAWAAGSVGQIAQITGISGNTLTLASEMRMDYLMQRTPAVRRILPVENTGVECLKIQRVDNTAPEQASNISFDFVVNSWVNGVAFQNTTFAHVEASHSSNIDISNCHFKDAFEYGDGGRAYGVMLQFSSNECRVYNNIFDHLRHSMILQAGANGNVFCYNYSINPFWTGSAVLPSNSAGDMVLHGNYVFANLFEQNDGQNIVIDNSHGGNGPFNTFFRNRASLWGIFFSDTTSPGQNFVGNEIPNTSFPYSVVNYTLLGSNHFSFGNNNKNTITPTGTSNLSDVSYCYGQRPSYIPLAYWAKIGPENTMNSGKIPAGIHLQLNELTAGSCGGTSAIGISENANERITLYPNPVQSGEQIQFNKAVKSVEFITITGKSCLKQTSSVGIVTATSPTVAGFYTIVITDLENRVSQHPIVIID
jgi:hypothetical protein